MTSFAPALSAPDPVTCKNICFIDSTVTSFQDYLNTETYPIVYHSDTNRESLKTFLLTQFTHIDRISFVFHGTPDNSPVFAPKLVSKQPVLFRRNLGNVRKPNFLTRTVHFSHGSTRRFLGV